MTVIFDVDADEARELRQALGSVSCEGAPELYAALNQAIENEDEARWEHLEEGKIL